VLLLNKEPDKLCNNGGDFHSLARFTAGNTLNHQVSELEDVKP
jgi:hypothetical protein